MRASKGLFRHPFVTGVVTESGMEAGRTPRKSMRHLDSHLWQSTAPEGYWILHAPLGRQTTSTCWRQHGTPVPRGGGHALD